MSAFNFLQMIEYENDQSPGTHFLELGLTNDELEEWLKRYPGVILPTDLIAFLRKCNGFRLYSKPDTPIGAIRLLPLREVEYAPRLIHAGNTTCDEMYPISCFTLTDDPDSAQHLVLNTASGLYYDVDPIVGIEEDGIVGSNWLKALAWIVQRAGLGP